MKDELPGLKDGERKCGKGETCDKKRQPGSEMNKGSVEGSGIWR